jgi:cell shape-determining protein MreC
LNINFIFLLLIVSIAIFAVVVHFRMIQISKSTSNQSVSTVNLYARYELLILRWGQIQDMPKDANQIVAYDAWIEDVNRVLSERAVIQAQEDDLRVLSLYQEWKIDHSCGY